MSWGERSARASVGVLGLALLAGCGARISQPRGETHLAAMAEASRHVHHGRFEAAAASWERAARTAERRVDREEAEYARARALLRLDRPNDALPILDALARHRPVARRTVRARFDAARIRWDRGEREAALRAFTWVVEEHPESGPARRSLSFLQQDQTERPLSDRLAFLEALHGRIGASDLGDDLLAGIAELQVESGRREEGMRTLERLVEDHPYPRGQRWDEALDRLADLAEEAGDYEGAIAYLQRMVEAHELTIVPGSQTLPGFPGAMLRTARLYRDRLDDPERAAEYFRATYERFPTSRLRDDAMYELGLMWLERGDADRGCSVLREVVAEFEVGHARRLAGRRLEADCGG